MRTFIKESLPWRDPVSAAHALAKQEQCFALLYSGQQTAPTGRYSFLALHPLETVSGEHFSSLADRLGSDCGRFDNLWFGYLGYELLHDIEVLPAEHKSYITLPGLRFTRFGLVLAFDHRDQTVTAYRLPEITLPPWDDFAPPSPVFSEVQSLTSSMQRQRYLEIIRSTKDAIARGDFYQANITRKFTGTFRTQPDLFSLFLQLAKASPAAYSALIRHENTTIISSSPECFLTVDDQGNMQSRPIKGTAPRFADETQDEASRAALAASEKDKAENLMIVDLMRNDLARSCVPGSVKVERLFEISSYATLHHMASTITGQKRADISTLDAVRSCFPPGSMTGAPKISAMRWCLEHEAIRRGVYSGALGWFGGDGSCDLSVVIRTLVIEDNRFEFQTGGAITSGSDPENEWQETMTKARGIMNALGVDMTRLEQL
ncbi:MAG TPA: anthranilate synthase component I family protein [Rickettsiales bacterium]|nr:anthranilate synthase component I family protein [Rickettsiales bacterium]